MATLFHTAPALTILVLWLWAGQGRPTGRPSGVAPRFRGRFAAVSVGLGLCLGASLGLLAIGEAAAVGGGLVAIAAGLVGAAAVTTQVALDPARTGFWHHRRIRPLGLALLGAIGLALGAYLPRPDLLPVVFAGLVFQRHLRGSAALLAQGQRDVEDLRIRNVALVAALRLQTAPSRRDAAPDRVGDKLKKAG